MTSTFEAAPGITGIDTKMTGRSRVTSAYLVDADEPVLVETGPSASAEEVHAGLDGLGIGPGDLAHVVVTHIHLDHAGGIGHIASLFPEATLWVHERGARHLADPTRLVQSAAHAYGGEAELQKLYGTVRPAPADRLRALIDGDRIDLGNRALQALYTPGHASHHVALADSSTDAIFTGDAVGVHLPDVGFLRPAAPPPEFDLEQAITSIRAIRARARGTLMFSHYGPTRDVETVCDRAVVTIRTWSEAVRAGVEAEEDAGAVERRLREATKADIRGLSEDQLDRLEAVGGYRLNAMGLTRYWRERLEDQSS